MYTLAVNSNDQRAINEWYVVHKHKHCECCVPVCGTHTRSSHAAHVNHMQNTLYVCTPDTCMWIVDILPLHDTIARLPLHEEGSRFIIVVHRTKRDYYTDVACYHSFR